MKILMATMGMDIGGAETHIAELAVALRRLGHDVCVVSNGGVYVAELERAGVRHENAPLNRRSFPTMFESLCILYKIIKREKPDIVHAHARIPGFLCGILQKFMRFPFVTTAHWVFSTEGAVRLLTNWGDRTIAVSEDISRYLQDNYGVPEKNIFVTINGIDTDKFSPEQTGDNIRSEFGIPENAPVIAHVSRLDEDRALTAKCLAEGAVEMAERVPDIVILIAGDGDAYNEVAAAAERANVKLGRRCVIMAGARTDINEIIAAGDVFVGVSRAALEAMSGGKPVILSGNEGYLGLFTEEKLQTAMESNFCCRGAESVTTEKLADDTLSCLALSEDEKERFGTFGRELVMRSYSVSRMTRDTLRAYKSAMPKKTIVMSGYYGFDNAGDEAILESVLQIIRSVRPDAEPVALSRDPAATQKTYKCASVSRFNPLKVASAIRHCDMLIFGGGSLLQDATSTRSLIYYITILRYAERKKKRTVMLANGIGPVLKKGNRRRVKKAVELADVVTLRDEDSLKALREMGVRRDDIAVTADPVFLLPPPDDTRTDEILKAIGVRGKFITISVRPVKSTWFYSSLSQIADALCEKYGVMAVFLSLQPERDESVSREIAKLMKGGAIVLHGKYTARELMGIIGRSELVLSIRLHSLIFAACTATPAVGFSYDPKVESYLRMLDQPLAGEIDNVDVDRAVEITSGIMDNRDDVAEKLKEKREAIIELAKKNAQVL